MEKTNKEIYDLLRRAFEMEETMAHEITGLCINKEPIPDIPESSSHAIAGYLDIMNKDTARHKEIVKGLLDKYKQYE